MLTQTDYGVHALSGERTDVANHIIDFFAQQDFAQSDSKADM